MAPQARTPEELEALLEDAFVVRDRDAVADMFAPGAVLLAGHAEHRQAAIAERVAAMWGAGSTFLAAPRHVVQARDTALVLADHSLSVMRRSRSGDWRYAIWMVPSDHGRKR